MKSYADLKVKFKSLISHLVLQTPEEVLSFIQTISDYGFIVSTYYKKEFLDDIESYKLKGFLETDFLQLVENIKINPPNIEVLMKDKKTYTFPYHSPENLFLSMKMPPETYFLLIGFLMIKENMQLFQLVNNL
jgi:hypothetical protein